MREHPSRDFRRRPLQVALIRLHTIMNTPINLPAWLNKPGFRALYVLPKQLGHWFGHDLVALGARASMAGVFLMSGRTKVDGLLTVSDTAIALFEDEYRLPLLSPSMAAHLATYAEHLFPVMLVLGLATRLSALGLLVMTLVIQFLVYPSAWPSHLTWATLLVYLVGHGAGRWSVDHFLGRH